ncbi:MAG: DotA/TraY family protein [Rhodospirillales bacterium]|nr:DotA/TraY family protein [Rhodospirillales bacterium]
MLGNVTKKQVLHYVLMPSVMPRLNQLVFSGFGFVALFVAQIFFAARLLPVGHPYLLSANMGKFGIRHVLAEAANNLVFSRQNSDQIIILFTMLLGMVLLLIQLFFLGMALFIQTAHAGMPATFEDFFATANPDHDIAFILLDRVFAVPDIFNSCVMQPGVNCTFAMTEQEDPVMPFHDALRSLFQMYSMGLLVVAMLIFMYYVVAIVAETAESGTPFGRRFNHVWAPVRMVVAIGLLVPVANGLNSAQYIVLYAAKWGSGFATNGWNLFVDTGSMAGAGGQALGDPSEMVVIPNPPPINGLLEFYTVMQTCRYAEHFRRPEGAPPVNIDAYLVRGAGMGPPGFFQLKTYGEALDFYNKGDILIRFGEHDFSYLEYENRIAPVCGNLSLRTTTVDDPTFMGGSIGAGGAFGPVACNGAESGAGCMRREFYELLRELYENEEIRKWGCAFAVVYANQGEVKSVNQALDIENICNSPTLPGWLRIAGAYLPTHNDLITKAKDPYEAQVKLIVETATIHERTNPKWFDDLKRHGWAGAGIWYNKIAQLNGAMIASAYDLPRSTDYPMTMKAVYEKRSQQDSDVTAGGEHCSYMSDQKAMTIDDNMKAKALAMCQAQDRWNNIYDEPTNVVFIDAIKTIFGLEGLYNIRDNETQNVHPLAQLVGIGKSLVDSAIINLGYATGAWLGGGVASLAKGSLMGTVGGIAVGMGKFIGGIAMIGLTVGFVLFYVIPFLPFLYFFFAVGNWIKGIFEAMVGVPLWALAHIRIDGNGLPGDAAMTGYYLIFEIFLRPILIIFGLLAGILIFAAQVRVLHEIWELVVSNIAGFDEQAAGALLAGDVGSFSYYRGVIDEFFYTVIYAIIVYMLGMASFKLVDLIPNHIMRWLGASVSTFAEQAGESAENLVRNTFVGSGTVMGQLGGGLQSVESAASNAKQFVQGRGN